jgi:hypothetical protein
MGMSVSSLSSFIFCNLLHFVPTKTVITWRTFLTKMVPVGFFMALTMHTGNVAYMHLTLSFIQVGPRLSSVGRTSKMPPPT